MSENINPDNILKKTENFFIVFNENKNQVIIYNNKSYKRWDDLTIDLKNEMETLKKDAEEFLKENNPDDCFIFYMKKEEETGDLIFIMETPWRL